MDQRYGFFQDDSGQKFLIVADYFSKFPFIFPVTSTHHQKTLRYLRDLFFDRRRTICCDDRQWTTLQWWRIQVFHKRIWLQAPDVLTAFPSVKWIHWGHGEEGESHLQEDGWISKCSGESTIAAMQHTNRKRLAITSGDFTWTARTRSCHAPTSQTHQYPKNPPMSARNTKHAERTLWPSSQSQGWVSSESERTG